jgi:hypothetical protein
MVKKKVGSAHRYKALQGAGSSSSTADAEAAAGPKPPQHLQKKITKKVQFFEKVAQSSTAAALQAKKGLRKRKGKAKSALPDLQSLAGELEQLAGLHDGQSQQQGQSKQQQRSGKGIKSSIKRSKARLAVGIAEMQRLQQVMQHPMYKADPIQAITNHLNATMPAAAQPPKQQQQGSKKKKKISKSKGAGGGVADMQS